MLSVRDPSEILHINHFSKTLQNYITFFHNYSILKQGATNSTFPSYSKAKV